MPKAECIEVRQIIIMPTPGYIPLLQTSTVPYPRPTNPSNVLMFLAHGVERREMAIISMWRCCHCGNEVRGEEGIGGQGHREAGCTGGLQKALHISFFAKA